MAGQFAVVTGASTGIGFELARLCARKGYDLLIVADEPEIETAAEVLRKEANGVAIVALQADLATVEGVDKLYEVAQGRKVDLLMANAGRGLGHAFLDQDWAGIRQVIDTNVTGTTYLIHRIGQAMWRRDAGRILITGSIAGLPPAAFRRSIMRPRPI